LECFDLRALLVLTLFTALIAPVVSHATDCSRWPRFASNAAYLQPLSVSAAEIDDHLNGSTDLEGIEIAVNLNGHDLQLDVLSFPGDVTAAAALRVIFMIGRLSDESYDRLVLIDEEVPLFYISEADLRSVGCRFIWRQQRGENPNALMRDFYSNLYFHETDQPVVRGLNGSLLGDTQRVLQANNEVMLPAWIVSAIK
jgi:hypothetical protein